MKVYYLNDEKIKVSVKTPSSNGEYWDWQYEVLEPAEGKLFIVHGAPEGSIPFIKRWGDGTIMISWADKDSFGAETKS